MRTFEAAVLVPCRNGKFLLQLRADTVPRWPGYWGTFGGGIEQGEDINAALRREMHEELGYKVRNPQFAFTQELPRGRKHVFYEQWDGTEQYHLDPRESVDHRWCTLSEAHQLKIIPHDLEALERLTELLQ